MTYPLSPYIWPSEYLVRPGYETALVYLDLNHWIGLAQADVGHARGGEHVNALETLREAKASGRVLVLLSGTHYMEIAGITQSRHRRDIARIMEELTEFRTILSRAVILELEIEAALDELIGPSSKPYGRLELVRFGVGPAFGLRGGLRIRSADGEDVTQEARATFADGPDAFDEMMREMNRRLERGMLEGPPDSQVAEMRADGWDPGIGRRIAEERAQVERDLAAQLDADPRWRRGRLRDVVAGRHLLHAMNEQTVRAIVARGRHPADVIADREVARRFVDSMPSTDVTVTLTTAEHRNPQRAWTPNDIFDIDAASIAAAYCDVLVTDAHTCNALTASKVDERANAKVFSSLNELAGHLAA